MVTVWTNCNGDKLFECETTFGPIYLTERDARELFGALGHALADETPESLPSDAPGG